MELELSPSPITRSSETQKIEKKKCVLTKLAFIEQILSEHYRIIFIFHGHPFNYIKEEKKRNSNNSNNNNNATV